MTMCHELYSPTKIWSIWGYSSVNYKSLNGMPSFEECKKNPSLQGKAKAFILHTGNEERNVYANDAYHTTKTFPSEGALMRSERKRLHSLLSIHTA